MMARGPDGRSGSSIDTSDMGALYRCGGPGRYTLGAVKFAACEAGYLCKRSRRLKLLPWQGM